MNLYYSLSILLPFITYGNAASDEIDDTAGFYNPSIHTHPDTMYTRQIPRKPHSKEELESYEQLIIFHHFMGGIGLLNYNETCFPSMEAQWSTRTIDEFSFDHSWFRKLCNWYKFLKCTAAEGMEIMI